MFTFFVVPYKQVDLYLHSPEMEYKKMGGNEGQRRAVEEAFLFCTSFFLAVKIDDSATRSRYSANVSRIYIPIQTFASQLIFRGNFLWWRIFV